ncbi:uncharacterized protein LOC144715240 [Wolffia australiana]
MEEAEEKMAALKRAYADVILNMAKESAARIVASEQKALRFKQDLSRTKDEAISTLVRVKSILDSNRRTLEATIASQARTIKDLESRLADAESTIDSLRTVPCAEIQPGFRDPEVGSAALIRCSDLGKDGENLEEKDLGGEKTIKYTFTRKRKKGGSSLADETEKKDGFLERNSTVGYSRDSRRIVQVARQLISLSEKKW